MPGTVQLFFIPAYHPDRKRGRNSRQDVVIHVKIEYSNGLKMSSENLFRAHRDEK
jgi:hypothetical protein